jgi:hypothetical protein
MLRSSFWQKNIWVNIVLGILSTYLLLNIFAIGYFANVIIIRIYKNSDVVTVFTGFMFFYFLFDLLFRFIMQTLPTVSIQPYLALPIKKSRLLHFPLIKSVPSFFNLLALLLIMPFYVKVICSTKPFSFSIAWGITALSLIVVNNYLIFSLKKYFYKRPFLVLFLLIVAGGLVYLDFSQKSRCSGYFSNTFLFFSNVPLLSVVPSALAVVSYYLGYLSLRNNSYLEEINSTRNRSIEGFSFLNRYGQTGNLLRTELKLILRNKRTKSLLVIGVVFLLYGLIFYRKENINNYYLLLIIGVVFTSAFTINYGQRIFAWEGSFFDGFIANKVHPYSYVRSKYLLLLTANSAAFIITLPYALFNYKIGLVNLAMALYNAGIASVLLIFFCTYNTSSIDTGKSQFMNYQGMSATQFLMILPSLGLPTLIYLPFHFAGYPQYSFIVLGIMGFAGIIFNGYLTQIVTKQFIKRKYKMAYGFRKSRML